MKKYRINTEEPELISEIIDQIKKNGGYCPCKVLHNEDTKCMCQEFKDILNSEEKAINDTCACGLYRITGEKYEI